MHQLLPIPEEWLYIPPKYFCNQWTYRKVENTIGILRIRQTERAIKGQNPAAIKSTFCGKFNFIGCWLSWEKLPNTQGSTQMHETYQLHAPLPPLYFEYKKSHVILATVTKMMKNVNEQNHRIWQCFAQKTFSCYCAKCRQLLLKLRNVTVMLLC